MAELLGEAQAQTIQLAHEYAPEPPFQAGTPETAPSAVIAAAKERVASTRKAREAIIDQLLASGLATAS